MARKKAAAAAKNSYTAHLIAGATGDLVHRMLGIAAGQFPNATIKIVDHPLVDSEARLQAALAAADGPRSIVIHALPSDESKRRIKRWCVPRSIPEFDATGPLIDFISTCVGQLPENDLSRLHQVDMAYGQRIEAMEFALQHDDGLGLPTLRAAEIVIVGVSRVSKSPTTLYLASRGYKTANVSISPQTGFPPELAKISQKKIVALTTQPKLLQAIRSDRADEMGMEHTDYDDLPAVRREVMEAEAEYRRRGWPVVNVAGSTIEKTAAQIIELLKLPTR
ncbi:Putative pyruvate, phosphate dikinase regulatory protein [Pirellulimonas nuda]|uniref:Pyruvate, phosphate dikinase regulatory protein n=1 Tax=Pirellulimonas nuda TaxID=2528009 RepID=A0A518DI07_9BACT|nr:pyruvate, phosphate dikinase/phosphoenolpyruvate synthase regulator [Pirellulimonas nuda]QDU91120.1 Putative pyruvate, phosphate dikinase regulatory protein [Pirellulimonas nuda]